jgi:phosphoribosylglycinamide formyltransferase 1
MDSLVDAIRYEGLDAEISVLISNKKCDALERAKGFDIPAILLESKGIERETYDKALDLELKKHNVDLILLVGYMRILSKWFVSKWHRKIMNVHPSLLPDFAGEMDMDVHKAVLASGKKETGATVHFVDETLDLGPIVVQGKVNVSSTDTPESLKERVQQIESELLVVAVRTFGEGKMMSREHTAVA